MNTVQDPIYKELILDHWRNPNNYGTIEDANFENNDSNPLCGDEIHITATIKSNKICDIKFTGQGCAISTASASIFTDMVKGQTIEDVVHLHPKVLLHEFGIILTPARIKCALLPFTALQNGLNNFRSNQ